MYTPPPLAELYEPERKYRFTELDPRVGEVTIKQAFSDGIGVGAVAWNAGDALARYICDDSLAFTSHESLNSWEGLDVVEIGAGVGLVSIVAARKGAKVISTDGVQDVVMLLEENIQQNSFVNGNCSSLESDGNAFSPKALFYKWGEEVPIEIQVGE